MRKLSIFLFEWIHFSRNLFKIIAVLLFITAGIYGLHNGANLYNKQNKEINRLNLKAEKDKEAVISYFEKGEKGPKNRPWVDNTTPFWAIWNTPTYYFKKPSSTIVYNIGQTEQYGFYKAISTSSSPYDKDITKEISNPERIQVGTLDFSFTTLFLLPLLLLVLLYDIKGAEAEQGFLPLVIVQSNSKNGWLILRLLFYILLLTLVIFALMFYGATLTSVSISSTVFWGLFLNIVIYLILWITIYFIIIKFGKNIVSNTLQMMGIWVLFIFLIPAIVHQYISINNPTNLMVDIIDVKRDKTEALYAQPNNVTDKQLFTLFSKLKDTPIAKDSIKIKRARRNSMEALVNITMKDAIASIEKNNQHKNNSISNTYWFNPVSYFQNKLNRLTNTHYNDYEMYRNNIQKLVDKRVETMVYDIWNNVTVNKTKYLEYNTTFKEVTNNK